jgi:hypothetical protein
VQQADLVQRAMDVPVGLYRAQQEGNRGAGIIGRRATPGGHGTNLCPRSARLQHSVLPIGTGLRAHELRANGSREDAEPARNVLVAPQEDLSGT